MLVAQRPNFYDTPNGTASVDSDGFEAMKLAQPDLESMIHEKCLGALLFKPYTKTNMTSWKKPTI